LNDVTELTPDLPIYGSLPPEPGYALEKKILDLRAKGFRWLSSQSSGDVAREVTYLRCISELFNHNESLK